MNDKCPLNIFLIKKENYIEYFIQRNIILRIIQRKKRLRSRKDCEHQHKVMTQGMAF